MSDIHNTMKTDDVTTTTKPRSLEELYKYMNETWAAGEMFKLTEEEEELLRAEGLLKGPLVKQEDLMNKLYEKLKNKLYEELGMTYRPSMSGWKMDDSDVYDFTKMGIKPDPEPEPAPSDSVNHPSHYTFGDIEVIDYIRDKLTPEEFQGYCNGNVLKYISRWRHKGGVEDLKKADVYLCWMIESALGERSNPIRKNYRADDEKRRSV